jgi:hypothetical protein
MATDFVVGITGTGLLVTVTFANTMLMYLTAVDCITLFINVLLDNFHYHSSWKLGVLICKLFLSS